MDRLCAGVTQLSVYRPFLIHSLGPNGDKDGLAVPAMLALRGPAGGPVAGFCTPDRRDRPADGLTLRR